MDIAFHISWWMIPAAIAIIGCFFLPAGPGGVVITGLSWLVAIAMVIGHFIP